MRRSIRALAALGAFACAVAVGLGAYAMHAAVSPHDHERVAIAAIFLFGHGLALAALAPRAGTRVQCIGLYVLLAGTILFSGSLVCAAVFGIEPRLAPAGGTASILGWLLVAAGFVPG
ncbi:MAG TPA: DUF423 domain-containing protein [Xanthomonadaceae bacterium]